MRPRRSLVLLLALLAIAPTCDGSAPKKKLIEFGWDEPDPAFMRKHLAQLEASPFDGCVYHLPYPEGLMDKKYGKAINYAWAVWGKRRFREEELSQSLADLRATKFKRFRSTFLRMNVTPATLDWFDDHTAVMSNLRLGASIARRGGSAGVLLDTEQYQEKLFDYSAQRDKATHTYGEYAAQARRRGEEAMRALEKGYPGLTVFVTFTTSYVFLVANENHKPLEQQYYGLLPPFIDGMIAAASDSAKIVDGMEVSYPMKDPAGVDYYWKVQTSDVLPWYADSTKYRRVVSRSFGIWIDPDNREWHLDDTGKNYRTPAQLQAVTKRALAMSDEYVWVYGQRPRWWTKEGKRKDVPDAYDKALRNAK